MSEIRNLTRRGFLKSGAVVSGGLVLGFHLPRSSNAAQAAPATQPSSFVPNAFLRIGTDDSITAN